MSLRAIGMIYLLIFTWLSVVHLSIGHVETTYGTPGKHIFLTASVSNTKNCLVVSNKGDIFDKHNVTSPNLTINTIDDCVLSMTLDPSMKGLWTIKVAYSDDHGQMMTKKKFFFVNVKDVIKEDRVLPLQDVIVADGNYMLVHLAYDYDNITSCTLLNQNNEEYNLTSLNSDLISIYKHCGVRIKVNISHSGEWKLFAHIGNNEVHYGSFRINVINQTNTIVSYNKLYAERGSKSYQLSFAQNSIYCEIQNPEGDIVRRQSGSCVYFIPVVTSYHNGTWQATYYIKGQLIALYSKIDLQVYDVSLVNATVTHNENGDINLLCRYHEDARIRVCRFEDPNKNVIFMNPATGNRKYEYYGNGFGYSSVSQDCGITIRQPNSEDFGIWRCLIDVKDKSSHEGSILHVKREPDNCRKVTITGKIYVRHGNSFQIKCKAQSALKYCSIKSPNGTAYFTTTSKKLPRGSVAYEGAGLAMGECGAILPGVNYSDTGDWSCHMGLYEGPELEARVPVIVTESSIMAEQDRMELKYADMPITLSCIPIPGSEFDIDYCRWIKPDGTAIQYQVDAQYSIQTNHRYCKLVIKDNKYENIGRWTCIAGITYDTNSEAQAHIDIHSNDTDVLFISLGSCFVIVVVTIILYVLYRNKLKQQPKKDNSIDFKYLI